MGNKETAIEHDRLCHAGDLCDRKRFTFYGKSLPEQRLIL